MSGRGIMGEPTKPKLYDYLDYRGFLRAYYVHQKSTKRTFSFRAFSRRAKLKSPNYLKLVMEGERNLSSEMAARFAEALGLDAEESTYFVNLVAFNQATTVRERNVHYRVLTGSRRYRQARRLELAQAAYHSTWYLPAIRELAAREDFRNDPAWIGRTLKPQITANEARQAIATLLAIGLLEEDEEGQLSQSDQLVTTGPETRSLHIANYHHMMLQRAIESIDLVPSHERDISSLTLCLSANGLRRLKTRIQSFRRELLELSLLEGNPEQVVQLNFQLFPLSRRRDEEDVK
jgi:uncharacterized protein (TIGR02147 family)